MDAVEMTPEEAQRPSSLGPEATLVPNDRDGKALDQMASPSNPRFAKRIAEFLIGQESLGVVIPLVLLALVLWFTQAGFYSSYNLESIGAQGGIFMVVGLSQMCVLAIGELNLALPAMSVSSAWLFAYVSQSLGVPLVISLIFALGLGALMGMVQGALVARARLNPFVTTLGLASVYMGLLFLATGTVTYRAVGGSLANVGTTNLVSVPLIAWLAVFIGVVMYVMFQRTVAGRETLATGANRRAALFSAIPVQRRVMLIHAMSGLLAAAAALLAVANLAEVDTSLGQSWLLPSFVAPVLGGTLLTGGRISVVGTALGGLLLALLQTAMILLGVSQYWYQMGLGLVLLLSVLIGQARIRYLMQSG